MFEWYGKKQIISGIGLMTTDTIRLQSYLCWLAGRLNLSFECLLALFSQTIVLVLHYSQYLRCLMTTVKHYDMLSIGFSGDNITQLYEKIGIDAY